MTLALLALVGTPLAAQQAPTPRPPARDSSATSPTGGAIPAGSPLGGRPAGASDGIRTVPGLLMQRSTASLRLESPAPLQPWGYLSLRPASGEVLARARAEALTQSLRATEQALWGQSAVARFVDPAPADASATVSARAAVATPDAPRKGFFTRLAEAARDTLPKRRVGARSAVTSPRDSAATADSIALAAAARRRTDRDSLGRVISRPPSAAGDDLFPDELFGGYADDLTLQLSARLESKLERSRNERCTSSLLFVTGSNCSGTYQPTFDFQFNVRSGGVVADRVHVNVDYDSQREFDASNNISIYYEGKTDELLQRIEVGNVSFQLPPSRFITAGIPSGNYGLQAIGQLGPMRFRTIVAQQKGNVVKDRVFTVGDRTLQNIDVDLEDYKVEARRFFFTVDPRGFPGYPNVDVLSRDQMVLAAASLPDSVRPGRIVLYRLRVGEQAQRVGGPQFIVRGARDSTTRSTYPYEVLREGVDYYLDPSQLWFALVRPLSLSGERLVVAYTTPSGGRSTAGGSPDVQFTEAPQFANLVFDDQIRPGDAPFFREIRSIYRFGGEDIQRPSVSVKIVTGAAGDQEKPVAGGFDTYLQMFGLAQASNGSTFDIENRLWPRPGDNVTGLNGRLIRDNYLVFPSLRPFAQRDSGLVTLGNQPNDTIYRTPSQDLFSVRHPQSLYRIRSRYSAVGGSDAGSLALGSVQVSRNSERILIAGRPLVRDVDYTVDYELGRVTFLRPDTLFATRQQVTVRFEENPLFAGQPTTILGLAGQFPLTNGTVNFTAISQSQKTSFTRPPLGFEPASSLVAGVSADLTFDAEPISRLVARLPFSRTAAASRVDVTGEFATSRPQPNAAGLAYIESFESDGGVPVQLNENAWQYASQPTAGTTIDTLGGGVIRETARAVTMAWQNNGSDTRGAAVIRTIDDIDPLVRTTNTGIQSPEQLLWLTLYPLSIRGLRDEQTGVYQWQDKGAPTGRHWRSIRTSFGAAGADLSRVETLEFWTLVDRTTPSTNPTLIFDFGDISERTLSIAPDTLFVNTPESQAAGVDSLFTGTRVVALDTLDSERNLLTRGFDVAQDDRGLPGDLTGRLQVIGPGGPAGTLDRVPTCSGGNQSLQFLGDSRVNCSVRNNRLDEEDLNFNGQLDNATGENVLRFAVDLSRPESWTRNGECEVATDNTQRCWVYVKVPFRAPTDSVGDAFRRRVQALRITMVSSPTIGDLAFSQTPLARLRLVGAPWLKRAERPFVGIGGERTSIGGNVFAGVIGTLDSTAATPYESPPGVTDAAEQRQTGLEAQRTQINERSMRIIATGLPRLARAEAYYRFPEGDRSFLGYRELRVWAKGQGNGWGDDGELQFYVKIGRDADNFYAYRSPARSGPGKANWTDVTVQFEKLFALRARLQNNFLQNGARLDGCTGIDSALVVNSPAPAVGDAARRYAACADGYIVYTADPNVAPPNLGAVQELAVGMVRVDSATGVSPIFGSNDPLELWIDDIRLTGVVDAAGYAGQFGVSMLAGDLADLRVNVSRRDPNFRQLAEQPSFITEDAVNVGSAVRLDRLLPASLGLSLPLSMNYSRSASDPFFLQRSDLLGAGIAGLRTPEQTSASYTLGVRRSTPLQGGFLAPIINNLALNGGYTAAQNRSEFQQGGASSFNVALDYSLVAAPRATRLTWVDAAVMRLPGWLRGVAGVRALRNTSLRYTPSQLRVTSALARTTDRRLSFTKPAESVTDTARTVRGLAKLWRNSGAFELRPVQAIALRWDLQSLRDLRDYRDRLGDTSAISLDAGRIAFGERAQLLGLDVGLERERAMSTGINFTPTIASWIRPRMDFGTVYNMTRDPNTRQLLRAGEDSMGAYRLPRRLSNSQTFSAGASIDIASAIGDRLGAPATGRDSGIVRRLTRVLQPADVNYSRVLTSTYDGLPFTPGLGYQFALGSSGRFRSLNGRSAAGAGANELFSVGSALALPFGSSLTGRYQRSGNRTWSRRFDNTLGLVEGANTRFPDVSLRWSFRPALLRAIVSSVGANAQYARTRATEVRPLDGGATEERSESRVRTMPINGSIAWSFLGGFSTSAGFSRTLRDDQRPGGANASRTGDFTVDLGKSLPAPRSWKVRPGSQLRTRFSYQQSNTSSFASTAADTDAESPTQQRRVRLADNGRTSFNFNGDADLSENATASIVFSHIVNFDEQNNRRFNQTVLTAVMNLQFYAGRQQR